MDSYEYAHTLIEQLLNHLQLTGWQIVWRQKIQIHS